MIYYPGACREFKTQCLVTLSEVEVHTELPALSLTKGSGSAQFIPFPA
jgi:hypothetical protein